MFLWCPPRVTRGPPGQGSLPGQELSRSKDTLRYKIDANFVRTGCPSCAPQAPRKLHQKTKKMRDAGAARRETRKCCAMHPSNCNASAHRLQWSSCMASAKR
eukprot:gene15267-biopygen8156